MTTSEGFSLSVDSDRLKILDAMDLHLRICDPEVLRELQACRSLRERQEIALSALKIGLLALRQASGSLDGDTLRREGDRLMERMQSRLELHQQGVTQHLAETLKHYFDPESGHFHERVNRLVKKGGELEQVLKSQIGAEDSELGRTLAAHLGADSPVLKQLSPDESQGVLKALGETMRAALDVQREQLLKEFSLDNEGSALNRLVKELATNHAKAGGDLKASVEKVVGEFSLDRDDSALSRLVKRVERAQKQISSEFSLDTEASALFRMKKELLDVLDAHRKDDAAFREEVKTTLATMAARRKESLKSTRHGEVFEAEVYRFLERECKGAGDVAAHTGATTGTIRNCKVGDVVIELGPEQAAAGAKIVVEAKEQAGYDLKKAREEIETARKNRGAQMGLFVFSARTAGKGLAPFARLGDDLFVVWDAEDEGSDLHLTVGLSVARALCTRAAADAGGKKVDLDAFERSVREVEKQVARLADITRSAETIQSGSAKILDTVRIMEAKLARELLALDGTLRDVREHLG